MANGQYWSVDELAARRLSADLKLEASDEQLARIAQHFSDHRVNMARWAAERVQSGMVQALETASATVFSYHSDEWAGGFRTAEELIVTTNAENALELATSPAPSKGQILRTLVRQARQG